MGNIARRPAVRIRNQPKRRFPSCTRYTRVIRVRRSNRNNSAATRFVCSAGLDRRII